MAELVNEKQAGYFLLETVLLSLLLWGMAVAAGTYMKAAELRAVAAVQGGADFIARAEFSYAQAWLEVNGSLPEKMSYLGDDNDLQQNGTFYTVSAEAAEDNGLWQLVVDVAWEAKCGNGEQEYKRYLAKH